MAKSLFLLLFLASFSNAYSTTFVPISIKKQIKQSDGVVEGEVISVESEQQDSGIVSKVTLLPNKWIGLVPKDSFVEVYFPGGALGENVQEIKGAPKFEIGERVVLFTKRHKERDWVNNLGLGKFSLKTLGKRKVIVNQIFPAHPQVGQMRMDKFYDLSEWVKKEKFKERFKDKYELNLEKEAHVRFKRNSGGRSIASVDETEEVSNKLPASGLVVIFAILGIIFGILRKKRS